MLSATASIPATALALRGCVSSRWAGATARSRSGFWIIYKADIPRFTARLATCSSRCPPDWVISLSLPSPSPFPVPPPCFVLSLVLSSSLLPSFPPSLLPSFPPSLHSSSSHPSFSLQFPSSLPSSPFLPPFPPSPPPPSPIGAAAQSTRAWPKKKSDILCRTIRQHTCSVSVSARGTGLHTKRAP